MNNCDCCFNDFLAKCEEEIVINTNLTTGDSYRWVITNKFGNKYEGTAIAGEDGELTIPVEDLPPGMFTQYSSDFTLHLFGADSCSPIKFKLTGEYDCVTFNIHGGTFEKNNIGCTTTFVPGIQPPSALAAVLAVGNDADGLEIVNAADPTTAQSLVTRQYYEDNLPTTAVPTLEEVLTEGNEAGGIRIQDVGIPLISDDAATKGYVDDGIEISATFAGIDPSIRVRFVYVTTDETNNGDISLYIHNGTTLKLVQTLQP